MQRTADLKQDAAHLLDGTGEQAEQKHAAHLHELVGKHEDADKGHIKTEDLDVGEGLEEVSAAQQEHKRGEDALARLVEREADKLQRGGIGQGKAGAREAVDLQRDDAGASGREAHEEHAGRLDAHEVAKADRGVMVGRHEHGVGEDAEDVIAQEADDARGDPAEVNARERAEEVVDLAAEKQVGNVDDGDDTKKRRLS